MANGVTKQGKYVYSTGIYLSTLAYWIQYILFTIHIANLLCLLFFKHLWW